MPRYFFHVDDGVQKPDREGTDLPGVREAEVEAVATAGSILKDAGGEFLNSGSAWRMHVTDEDSRLLFTLRFSADRPSGAVSFVPGINERERGVGEE